MSANDTASLKSNWYLGTELNAPKKNFVSIRPRLRPTHSTGGSFADNLISIPLIRLNEPQHKPTIKCSLLNAHSLGNKSLLVNNMVLLTGADLHSPRETRLRLTDTSPLVEIVPDGFFFIQKSRGSGCGGGLLLWKALFKNKLNWVSQVSASFHSLGIDHILLLGSECPAVIAAQQILPDMQLILSSLIVIQLSTWK